MKTFTKWQPILVLCVFTNSLDLMQIWEKFKLKKTIRQTHSFILSIIFWVLCVAVSCVPTAQACPPGTVHSFIIWRILINDVWSLEWGW